jgi:hypothetical protein
MSGNRLFGDLSQAEEVYALGAAALRGHVDKKALLFRLPGDGEPLLSLVRANRNRGGGVYVDFDLGGSQP